MHEGIALRLGLYGLKGVPCDTGIVVVASVENGGADVVFAVALYRVTAFPEWLYPVGRFYRLPIFVERIVVFDMECVECRER